MKNTSVSQINIKSSLYSLLIDDYCQLLQVVAFEKCPTWRIMILFLDMEIEFISLYKWI